MITRGVLIGDSDSLRATWLLFSQLILIWDVNLLKIAQVRYLCHVILLFLWGHYQVYDSGWFWQVLFCFSGYNLRSSSDPSMFSIPYDNSCMLFREELVACFLYFMTISPILSSSWRWKVKITELRKKASQGKNLFLTQIWKCWVTYSLNQISSYESTLF